MFIKRTMFEASTEVYFYNNWFIHTHLSDNISTMGSTVGGSMWSMRGLGQALQFLQNKPESTPLNAYLTYITLPWVSILEDILMPSTRKPILTFELDFVQHQRN